METRTVVGSEGVRIAVATRGDSAEPTVVLVHGYPDDRHVWDPIADRLAERYRVVTYDVRGAGESDTPKRTSAYRMESLLDDFIAVVDAVSPDQPVHLVGHDWGSIQSWEFACSDRTVGRIASFTSISGPSLDHIARWVRVRTTPRATLPALLRQARMSWYIAWFLVPVVAPLAWRSRLQDRWTDLLVRREQVTVDDRWPGPRSARNGESGIALYRANILQRLLHPSPGTVHVPTQVIVPLGDRFISEAMAGSLGSVRSVAPGATIRRVPGSHWIVRQRPELVARWITDHVDASCRWATDEQGAAMEPNSMESSARRPQVAVVTGAGSGIGRETAVALAERGYRVVAADINTDAAERTALLCRTLSPASGSYTVDVSDEAAMEAFAKAVKGDYGVPDVVVNNAGIAIVGPMLATTGADWDRILGVNLWGVINGSRLFGEQQVERGEGGHIINVSSAAAFAPNKTMSAYATTKAAVLMLTECLRAELAAEGVSVSAVCPGFVHTPITLATQWVGATDDEQERKRAATDRLYRLRGLTPDKVADAVLRVIDDSRPIELVGFEARATRALSRLSPRLGRRLAEFEVDL